MPNPVDVLIRAQARLEEMREEASRVCERLRYTNQALEGLLEAIQTAEESLPPDGRTVLRAALAGRDTAAQVVLGL